jgi:hypothetical protein
MTGRKRSALCFLVLAIAMSSASSHAVSFELTSVTPSYAYSCGNLADCRTIVTLHGRGFGIFTGCNIAGCAPDITFGESGAVLITAITDTEIFLVLPVHPPGVVDITLRSTLRANETVTLQNAFRYLDPTHAIPAINPAFLSILAVLLAIVGLSRVSGTP